MRAGVGSVFLSVGTQVDVKNPSRYILTCSQGGMGLPSKDYYLEPAQQTARTEYVQHVTNMLSLSGTPPDTAQSLATNILEFETKLANVSLRPEEMRDPDRLYNRMSGAALDVRVPGLRWVDFFADLLAPHFDFEKETELIVEVPEFLSGLATALASTAPSTLQAYMQFRTLHSYSSQLPAALRNETFRFYSKTLAGQQQQAVRWKKCVGMTDANLPDAVGESYTRSKFSSLSRTRAENLVKAVEAAFATMLSDVSWMDSSTRERASQKLDLLGNNIGYPTHPTDYTPIASQLGNDLFENARIIREFEIKRDFKKIGQPVDRGEWDMSAATVNAYYDPSKNIMVFPAAILQPPFFDASAPPAMNFGSIGAVMGHELTHAFDDEGRKYNGNGQLTNWWEPQTISRFDNATKCIEDEFGKFPVQGSNDTFVNGKLTLGENIADLGGLIASLRAFRHHKQTRSHVTAALDFPPPFHFLSEDQLFFVSFAQAWCEKVRNETAILLARTDPHSPPEYRVKGTLSNIPEFAQAFSCPDNSPYIRTGSDRCQVW
eukprot:c11459_g1_i2.p1 GENE.c11459_g1_i2~~c11459_g1_i2.p1  ORF type:complete len:547 (+),score=146.89 c11459_g1_i2:674-2314(+)